MAYIEYHDVKTQIGEHYIVELSECNEKRLSFVEEVKTQVISAVHKGHGTILETAFHQFAPKGLTGILLLAESHVSIHTWPEHQYAAIDVFTCGETMNPDIIAHELKDVFEAKKMHAYVLERGIRKPE